MTTKLYLICEDVDLGYHVKGVYDNKKRAESKLKEYLDAWVKIRFFNEEIPEELLKEDGLINAYNWHQHYIEEMEMNSDEIEDEILLYRNTLKNLEAKKETQNDN